MIVRYGWICHAYCLIENHYHLVVDTPKANLTIGMRQLNGIYTQAFKVGFQLHWRKMCAKASAENLNQLLSDTITLWDMDKKYHCNGACCGGDDHGSSVSA